MNLITQRLHRIYLVVALLLVIPDTFYWYTLNDYSNIQVAFTAITTSTGLTWLIVSYLALFFAIFAQNLEMRAFLTLTALVTRIFFLVWITDIWRSNEVSFITLLKNVFIKTNTAPFIEAFATIALIPLILSLIIQKSRVANLLTALVNFLKSPSNSTHKVVFYSISGVSYLATLFLTGRSLLDNYDLAQTGAGTSFKLTYLFLIILGVIGIALKLLILGLALLAALWAWINWRADLKNVFSNLSDFEMTEYLTKKVAYYLYKFFFVCIFSLAAILIPIYASTYYGLNQDYAVFPMVAITGVLITFLAIFAVRLIYEFVVAVIFIAKNTKT
jgi:hypothetical protein